MKFYSYIFCFVISVSAKSQTFDIYNSDTINRTDGFNCRYGQWRVTGKSKPGTCFKKHQLVEEGNYLNSRKIGLWTEYYCNGKVRNKIPFVDGKPKGYCVLYYQNGKMLEEGDWKNNRHIGIYKQYDSLGILTQETEYDSIGKRIRSLYWLEDEQKYMIDSTKKSKKQWSNGNYIIPEALNGKQKLYNGHKQIAKDGIFQDNVLMDGKVYFYDENGILTIIAIYKDGKHIGDETTEKIKKIKKDVDEDGTPKTLK